MLMFSAADHPHRRFDPLSGRHVLVSPHRGKRPWQGETAAPDTAPSLAYDRECYLCPGNARANGVMNPAYKGPFAFTNDFAALAPDTPQPPANAHPLHQASAASGACRVVCFSPDHAATLPELPLGEIAAVIACWRDEAAALARRFAHVQIFENKGAMMGCSNPHPHSQIWATSFLPTEIAREDENQRAYEAANGRAMLDDLVALERKSGERVVLETDMFLAVSPYWAAWPFEILLLSKRPFRSLADLDAAAIDDLACALKGVTTRYDNLFACDFPYSMGFHGAPSGGDDRAWRLHAHFYPPLLRSASVRKFMVGFEMLAEAQRDLTPEQAAQRLRAQSDAHFRQRGPA